MTPYHHGNLRAALLDAAAARLADGGVGALSLRDLARRLGVSPTAPYHHFRTRADLVAALVEDALARLEDALEASLAAAPPVGTAPPGARLQAIGVAYVRFAVSHPALFRLAFRPELGSHFASLASGSGALPEDVPAFRVLVRVVREDRTAADSAASAGSTDDDALAALGAWSLVHGLASLLLDGPLHALAADPARVDALARALTSPDGC